MTQEEKQLLLTDLCARLLYKPVCHAGKINHDGNLYFINIIYSTVAITSDKAVGKFETCPIVDVKPYLRPMSSMSEKERDELALIGDNDFQVVRKWYNAEYMNETGTPCPVTSGKVDYCNKNHFDFRGLIPMGLALEAPDGMYNKN